MLNLNANNIYFAPEPKTNSKKSRIWNIKGLKTTLGSTVCDNILFVHAILGCDTTSRMFGLGKGLALNKFMRNADFYEQAKVFGQTGSILKEDVIKAGRVHWFVCTVVSQQRV